MADYEVVATSATPQLAIYLIDVSASMAEPLDTAGGKRKIDLVNDALAGVLKIMMRRSMKGELVSPRYGLSLLAYSTGVTNVYGKTLHINEALEKGLPALTPDFRTNTAEAFRCAYQILTEQLPHLHGCPAPIVCHLTDGEYNEGGDPRPIVQQIRSLGNSDGQVLVENIFVGKQLTHTPIGDIRQWPGVSDPSDLTNDYVRALYEMSSPLPESYAGQLRDVGYNLQAGVPMLIPAERRDLVELAFAMSGATNVQEGRPA